MLIISGLRSIAGRTSQEAGRRKYCLTPGARKFDWVSVHDPSSQYDQPLTGLSGTVISPDVSDSDNPFLHPFGTGFEFYVAPDEPYFGLLAPLMTNKGYKDATARANEKFNLNVPGVIGMECVSKLVPAQFRGKEGDRVALWGRWIVDSGHNDFHTEIRPPLIMATARPTRSQQQANTRTGADDATTVQIITRPYLVSQEFGDGGLFEHLVKELAKVLSPGIPLSTQVEAHPRLLGMPFRGLNIVTFKVRPPRGRFDDRDKLMVEFSFTRRDDSIAFQVLRGNDGESVRVVIVLNEAGTCHHKPRGTTYTVTLDELEAMDKTAGNVYRTVIFASILTGRAAPIILDRGIKSTKYEGPKAPVLRRAARVPVADLRPVSGPTDASEPFPLFGTVKQNGSASACYPRRIRPRMPTDEFCVTTDQLLEDGVT